MKLDGEWFKPEPELVNHIRTYMRPPEPQNTDAVAHPELRRQLLAAIEALRRQVLVLTAGG